MGELKLECASVQGHLAILQGIIGRMASNSASCKSWCITLVSAIVVVIADKEKPDYVWIALVPAGLFLFLDSYYVALERAFRDVHSSFIEKIHQNTASIDDFKVAGPILGIKELGRSVCGSLGSLSIWPLYTMLIFMLLVTRYIILGNLMGAEIVSK